MLMHMCWDWYTQKAVACLPAFGCSKTQQDINLKETSATYQVYLCDRPASIFTITRYARRRVHNCYRDWSSKVHHHHAHCQLRTYVLVP
jgi:hypothetical protein